MNKREIRLLDNLSDIAWGMKHFGSLTTNRVFRLKTMRRLERAKLAKNIGPVPMCDADGFTIVPERYRDGWQLTNKGERKLALLDEKNSTEIANDQP